MILRVCGHCARAGSGEHLKTGRAAAVQSIVGSEVTMLKPEGGRLGRRIESEHE
jgi:hypothetical protein